METETAKTGHKLNTFVIKNNDAGKGLQYLNGCQVCLFYRYDDVLLKEGVVKKPYRGTQRSSF